GSRSLACSYHPVGCVALGAGSQVSDLAEVHERQQRIGYPSDLIVGAVEVADHMRRMFPDWRAQGVEVCLHEHKGGFANNMASMYGLAAKAKEAGARLVDGVRVTGFAMDGSGAVTAVHSEQGDAAPVVVGNDFDVDPYPTASVESSFADMWCASLSHCMKRFEGKRATYKHVRSGGVGCFTADSFPVFDYMRPNAYVIAD